MKRFTRRRLLRRAETVALVVFWAALIVAVVAHGPIEAVSFVVVVAFAAAHSWLRSRRERFVKVWFSRPTFDALDVLAKREGRSIDAFVRMSAERRVIAEGARLIEALTRQHGPIVKVEPVDE